MNMSIKFIKENIKKFDQDNLITFLFDIIIRGGLDEVEDYNENKQYGLDDKVYYKDNFNVHHIYKCIVDNPAVGVIYPDEWLDLLQSFRKPIVDEETYVTSLDIKEEVIISTVDNQSEFQLSANGVEEGRYTVVVFHPEFGRLSRDDFALNGKKIVLNNEYIVKTKGSKLIVDLYKNK